MPKYKLIYFDVKGRAEPLRLIFAAAGQEFEDKRVSANEWQELKPKVPMNQLPVLEVDGRQLCQATAIGRYLAKHFDMAGKSRLDSARCDMYVEGVAEIMQTAAEVFFEKDDIIRTERYEHFQKTKLAPFLDNYERFLKRNDTGFLVGKAMTWADIYVFCFLAELNKGSEEGLLGKHKRLRQLVDKMADVDNIKKYVEKHWPTND